MRRARINLKNFAAFINAFYIICIILIPAGAQAAAIINLDSKPHNLSVNGTDVTIEAGRSWKIIGKAKIIYQNREIHMEDTDEYAIWNDHEFGPQRHSRHGTGMFK